MRSPTHGEIQVWTFVYDYDQKAYRIYSPKRTSLTHDSGDPHTYVKTANYEADDKHQLWELHAKESAYQLSPLSRPDHVLSWRQKESDPYQRPCRLQKSNDPDPPHTLWTIEYSPTAGQAFDPTSLPGYEGK